MDATAQSLQSPERINSEEELEEVMTRPNPRLVEAIRQVSSPLLILGGAGKMGPTLAVLAKRAAEQGNPQLRIVVASRFSDAKARRSLEDHGIETLVCDALDRESVGRLPDSENVLYLIGLKFGTSQNPALTWATNTIAPTHVAERFPRARIVALSTGNVYPLVPISSGGAVESDALTPLGEYANAAIARERVFEYHSRKRGTPMVILRLNYAVELRYGVLLEIAQKVWTGQAIDLTTGFLNCIWQGDANDWILRALPLAVSPPAVFNMTGRDTLSVRELAGRFGEWMDRPVAFVGSEAPTALLSNAQKLCGLLGDPPTPLLQVMRWIAHWVMEGRPTFGKPTHFQVRDGKF